MPVDPPVTTAIFPANFFDITRSLCGQSLLIGCLGNRCRDILIRYLARSVYIDRGRASSGYRIRTLFIARIGPISKGAFSRGETALKPQDGELCVKTHVEQTSPRVAITTARIQRRAITDSGPSWIHYLNYWAGPFGGRGAITQH